MKNYSYFKVEKKNGKYVLIDIQGQVRTDIYVRDHMLELAYSNDQCIAYDAEGGRAFRKDISLYSDMMPSEKQMEASNKIESDPILNFIHNEAVGLRPDTLVMPDLKWKYLVRSAMRAKNIMMTGAAGCGKTMAAKKLVDALDRPNFYFNLGATQDPRGTLIVINTMLTHYIPNINILTDLSLYII